MCVCVCVRTPQANDAGNFFPIWGTCMGMQLLTVLVAGESLLTNTTAENVALPLNLTAGLYIKYFFMDFFLKKLHVLYFSTWCQQRQIRGVFGLQNEKSVVKTKIYVHFLLLLIITNVFTCFCASPAVFLQRPALAGCLRVSPLTS